MRMSAYRLAHEPRSLLFQLAICLALVSVLMAAAVPQKQTTSPGFFRLMLGDFEVTALHDGESRFSTDEVMPTVSKDEVKSALQREYVPIPTLASVNAFLINTKEHLVLIDTGVGKLFGNCCGLLQDNLRASGYQPEQVDLVLITHLHIDHQAGLVSEGKMAFPNAVLRVSQAEADYWLNPENKADISDEQMKQNFDLTASMVAPYKAAGKFQPFHASETTPLVPGIRGVTRSGHTPGHSVYFVESAGHTLVAWGDIVLFPPVQMRNPSAVALFDSHPEKAKQSRTDLFELVREKKYLVAGAHTHFPGIGYVRSGPSEGTYEWVPVRYETDLHRNKTGDFSIAG